eukprot:jgi/Undpi1/10946/HiC_scaffold_30.g13247.m1
MGITFWDLGLITTHGVKQEQQSPDWARGAGRAGDEDVAAGDGAVLGARTRVVPGGREATKASRKEAKKRAKAEFSRSRQALEASGSAATDEEPFASASAAGVTEGSETSLAGGKLRPRVVGCAGTVGAVPSAAAAPQSRRSRADDVVPVVAAVAEVERRRCSGRVDGGVADVPAPAASSVVALPSCNAPVAPADVVGKDEAGVEAAAVEDAAGDVAAEGVGGAADGEIYVAEGAAASQTAAVAETVPPETNGRGCGGGWYAADPAWRGQSARVTPRWRRGGRRHGGGVLVLMM